MCPHYQIKDCQGDDLLKLCLYPYKKKFKAFLTALLVPTPLLPLAVTVQDTKKPQKVEKDAYEFKRVLGQTYRLFLKRHEPLLLQRRPSRFVPLRVEDEVVKLPHPVSADPLHFAKAAHPVYDLETPENLYPVTFFALKVFSEEPYYILNNEYIFNMRNEIFTGYRVP